MKIKQSKIEKIEMKCVCGHSFSEPKHLLHEWYERVNGHVYVVVGTECPDCLEHVAVCGNYMCIQDDK